MTLIITMDDKLIEIVLTNLIQAPVALIAFLAYKQSQSNSKLYIDEIIQNALINYREIVQLSIQVDFTDKKTVDRYDQLRLEARTEILNSYNRACAMYLKSNKFTSLIDKKLFRQERRSEVLSIFQNQEYNTLIGDHNMSQYSQLIDVYREFNK